MFQKINLLMEISGALSHTPCECHCVRKKSPIIALICRFSLRDPDDTGAFCRITAAVKIMLPRVNRGHYLATPPHPPAPSPFLPNDCAEPRVPDPTTHPRDYLQRPVPLRGGGGELLPGGGCCCRKKIHSLLAPSPRQRCQDSRDSPRC